MSEYKLPEPSYAMLSRCIGPHAANLLSRTVWKDGIDIEVVDAGVVRMLNETAQAAYQAGLAAERTDSIKFVAAVQSLTADLKYIAGIVERGTGKPLADDEKVTAAILGYVKHLEAGLAALVPNKQPVRLATPCAKHQGKSWTGVAVIVNAISQYCPICEGEATMIAAALEAP